MAHEPAFDGLRGIAVIAVLLYHGDFGWAKGGFLGVSTFFTLSGFLITTLLVTEWGQSSTIKLGSFYTRRVRRLLPASVLTLLVAVAYARFVATPAELATTRQDLFAAAAQVSNWWFIHSGRSYGALFRAPSIVQHYWSLAIEEQFYLLVPPLILLALRRKWSLGKLMIATGVGIALSMMATVIIDLGSASTDRIYYGTDTRAVELLIGVLLALVVAKRHQFSSHTRDFIVGAGTAALVASVGVWVMVSINNSFLYHGGLWLYGVCSGCIVLACREDGPVRSILSFKPLQQLGVISYGVYLLHWPIFQIMTPQRLHASLTLTFVLRIGVTLAAATLSFILLESPIRHGQFPRRTAPSWQPPATAMGALAIVFLAVGVVVPSSNHTFNIDTAGAEFQTELAEQRKPIVGAPRVAFFGDSTATALSVGVARWTKDSGQLALRKGATELGCGVLLIGQVRYTGAVHSETSRCSNRQVSYGDAARTIDVAVVLFGPWDVADHRLPGDKIWRHIGDPVYDMALRAAAEHLVTLLSAHGALVVWVLSPDIRLTEGPSPSQNAAESDPSRMKLFNDMILAMAASHPYKMRTIDLGSYLRSLPGGEFDPTLRPDGVHLTDATAEQVAKNWFGPELIKVVHSAGH